MKNASFEFSKITSSNSSTSFARLAQYTTTQFMIQQSPVECFRLKIIAFVFIVAFISSIYLNSSIIYIFLKTKKLNVSINFFLFALIVYNLVGTILEFPIVILNNFNCKWVFERVGCICSAFTMYFIGCTSVYLLVAISIERYIIFKSSINKPSISVKYNIIILFICTFFGLLWPIFPLFGWSYYSLETSLMTCSVEYQDKSLSVISYNIAMFGFVYFIPLLIIIMSNIKLIFLVKNLDLLVKMDQLNENQTIKNVLYRRKIRREKRITFAVIIVIVGYMFNWTPYAIISLNTAFFNYVKVDPYISLLLTLFAKSAFLWTPILYYVSDGDIRKSFRHIYHNKQTPNSDSTSFTLRDGKLNTSAKSRTNT